MDTHLSTNQNHTLPSDYFVEILFIGNRELPHTPTSDKKIYRISQKASSSRFSRYTVEVRWRTKIKMRKIIDHCAHLRPPTSRLACCTIMKKERRQKHRRNDRLLEKGKEEERKRKKDSDTSLMGLCHKKKKITDQEEEGMTRSGGEIQEGSD